MEIWKDIPNYEGYYQVSNLGRVKSLSRTIYKNGKHPFLSKEKILKTILSSEGYPCVNLSIDGFKSFFNTRILVAMAFLNYKSGNKDIAIKTKNNIKVDSRLENLEISTRLEVMNKKHLKTTSKYSGVSWSKTAKKWMAYTTVNKKRKYLGYYSNELEAYNVVKKELELKS